MRSCGPVDSLGGMDAQAVQAQAMATFLGAPRSLKALNARGGLRLLCRGKASSEALVLFELVDTFVYMMCLYDVGYRYHKSNHTLRAQVPQTY